MSKRPAGEPSDGAGGKRIHFADESIHGPEHLRLVRRMEEMEREMRSLRSQIAEKDALLVQYEEVIQVNDYIVIKDMENYPWRIHDLNEENKDLYRRIKEKAINTKDFGVQAEIPPLEAAPQVAPDAAPQAAPDAAADEAPQVAHDAAPLSPPEVPQAPQRRVVNLRTNDITNLKCESFSPDL
ncbi:hypothetical protein HNY73_014219 [Argiope bruennichi]|uniref:Uncharacterized protein n=1 Tax=Argiope bruennichi TaxID=94029 RepID=A0A8T0ETK8_ARGBR|nr:hypothetical protein HNY73_014219 [Argiope bruennichi]